MITRLTGSRLFNGSRDHGAQTGSAKTSHLVALALGNAVAISSLYLGQVVVSGRHDDLLPSRAMSLVPAASLIGYASGVLVLALRQKPCKPRETIGHLSLLSLALIVASFTRNATFLAVANVAVGVGAAVAQQLLANSAMAVKPDLAARAIARVIVAALSAVLLVKLFGSQIANEFGWEILYRGSAIIVFLSAVAVASTSFNKETVITIGNLSRSDLILVWQENSIFRVAVWQQLALFCAYNAGWVTILVEASNRFHIYIVIFGGVVGLVAAESAGVVVTRLGGCQTALLGIAAAAFGTLIFLPTAYALHDTMMSSASLAIGIALLDSGYQMTLVANQTRVQRLMPSMAGRLAASLTIFGAVGGAIGAALSYRLWIVGGWPAASVVAALASAAALLVSISPISNLENLKTPNFGRLATAGWRCRRVAERSSTREQDRIKRQQIRFGNISSGYRAELLPRGRAAHNQECIHRDTNRSDAGLA